MSRTHVAGLAGGMLALIEVAFAQTFITYDLRVTHAVLLPGEVQTIEVWAAFTPFPTKIAPNVTSIALGAVMFDLLNDHGFETGTTGNLQALFIAQLGKQSPNGDLVGSAASQPMLPPFYTMANPVHVLSSDWTPDPGLGPRSVRITSDDRPDYWREIIVQNPPFVFPEFDHHTVDIVNHDTVSWKVIPGPGGAVVFAGAALVRRRRR